MIYLSLGERVHFPGLQAERGDREEMVRPGKKVKEGGVPGSECGNPWNDFPGFPPPAGILSHFQMTCPTWPFRTSTETVLS